MTCWVKNLYGLEEELLGFVINFNDRFFYHILDAHFKNGFLFCKKSSDTISVWETKNTSTLCLIIIFHALYSFNFIYCIIFFVCSSYGHVWLILSSYCFYLLLYLSASLSFSTFSFFFLLFKISIQITMSNIHIFKPIFAMFHNLDPKRDE